MALAHILSDTDTLQGLSLQYYGDMSRWVELADYNKLAYPYLLKDKIELEKLYANGYVTVVRADSSYDAIIRKGWTFTTKASIFVGGVPKVFEVVEDTVIPAGTSTYYLPLRSSTIGTFGNAMEYMVTEVGANTLAESGVQFLKVYNEQCFTGGRDIGVLCTGDIIYIPENSSEANNSTSDISVDYTYGEDIVLDALGDVVFTTSGDIASVAGADNVRYAVEHRLTTELRSLMLHPEYGTELIDLIGFPMLANKEKLMQIAVQRALNQEDRIKDAVVNKLTVQGTAVYVDVAYSLALGGDLQYVSINTLNTLNGGGTNVI
jgi:phage baseplate assembly protein W